jgi:hypothetical protein
MKDHSSIKSRASAARDSKHVRPKLFMTHAKPISTVRDPEIGFRSLFGLCVLRNFIANIHFTRLNSRRSKTVFKFQVNVSLIFDPIKMSC